MQASLPHPCTKTSAVVLGVSGYSPSLVGFDGFCRRKLAFSTRLSDTQHSGGWRVTTPYQLLHRIPAAVTAHLSLPMARDGLLSPQAAAMLPQGDAATPNVRPPGAAVSSYARDMHQREAIEPPDPRISVGAQVGGDSMRCPVVCPGLGPGTGTPSEDMACPRTLREEKQGWNSPAD